MNVALREGVLVVSLDMGGDPMEVAVWAGAGARLDDNQWHHLTLERVAKEVGWRETFAIIRHTT